MISRSALLPVLVFAVSFGTPSAEAEPAPTQRQPSAVESVPGCRAYADTVRRGQVGGVIERPALV